MTTLVLVFKKIKSDDKTKHDNLYSIFIFIRAEIIISESFIDDVFQSIYTTIVEDMRKS